MRSVFRAWGAAVLAAVAFGSSARADLPIEQEPINYSTAAADDPVARLQKRIDRGEASLSFDEEGRATCKSVLEQLKVPAASQTLVFSKTSFQHTRISPRTPRALYFNDDVYVGWVQGGDVLEFAAVDPKLGHGLLPARPAAGARSRRSSRQTDSCLQCHPRRKTQDVPGLLVRSVFPDRRGLRRLQRGVVRHRPRQPAQERWGGWYVTGTHGGQPTWATSWSTDRERARAGSTPSRAPTAPTSRAWSTPSPYLDRPQRHRGADGPGTPDPDAEPDHPGRLPGADRPCTTTPGSTRRSAGPPATVSESTGAPDRQPRREARRRTCSSPARRS